MRRGGRAGGEARRGVPLEAARSPRRAPPAQEERPAVSSPPGRCRKRWVPRGGAERGAAQPRRPSGAGARGRAGVAAPGPRCGRGRRCLGCPPRPPAGRPGAGGLGDLPARARLRPAREAPAAAPEGERRGAGGGGGEEGVPGSAGRVCGAGPPARPSILCSLPRRGTPRLRGRAGLKAAAGPGPRPGRGRPLGAGG